MEPVSESTVAHGSLKGGGYKRFHLNLGGDASGLEDSPAGGLVSGE